MDRIRSSISLRRGAASGTTTVVVQPHASRDGAGSGAATSGTNTVPRSNYFVLRAPDSRTSGTGAGSGGEVTDEELAQLEAQFRASGARLTDRDRSELRAALHQARKLGAAQPANSQSRGQANSPPSQQRPQQAQPQQQQPASVTGTGEAHPLLDALPVAQVCTTADGADVQVGQPVDSAAPVLVMPTTVDPQVLEPPQPTRMQRLRAWLQRNGPRIGVATLGLVAVAGFAALVVVFPFGAILLLVGLGGVICAGGAAATMGNRNARW